MTLTEAVFWAKRAGIALIVFILVFIPLRLVFIIMNAQGPVVDPGEDVPYASQGYGSLPDISLTNLELPEEASPQFLLETPAGEFPDITPVAQVYQMPVKQQSLTALDEAKALSKRFKFESEPVRIPNTNKYQWTDSYGRVFTYNVANQNFNLETDFEKDVYQLKSIIPDLTTAEERSIAFLNKFGLYSESLEGGYVRSKFLKFSPTGEYLKANSQVEADLVRIDFFRKIPLKQLSEEEILLIEQYEDGEVQIDPENVPEQIITDIRTPDVITANISIIIRGTNFNKVGEVYEMEYNYWPIDINKTETYYTKDPAEAWQDVKNGNASLRYLVPKDGTKFTNFTPINVSQFLVYEIYLVYLETPDYQTYLQPVYLIQGEARTVGNEGKPDLDFAFMTDAIKEY